MTKNDIKTKLTNHLNDYKAKLEAWEQVKPLTKKDGKEFVIFSKNFANATTNQNSDLSVEYPELTVHYYSNGYKSDTIQIYLYKDDLKDGDPRKAGYTPHWHRQTYKYTVKETFEAIEEYKKRLKKHIAEYEKQLEDLEEFFEKADAIKNQIKEFLKDENLRSEYYLNSLGYALRDYIKDII